MPQNFFNVFKTIFFRYSSETLLDNEIRINTSRGGCVILAFIEFEQSRNNSKIRFLQSLFGK